MFTTGTQKMGFSHLLLGADLWPFLTRRKGGYNYFLDCFNWAGFIWAGRMSNNQCCFQKTYHPLCHGPIISLSLGLWLLGPSSPLLLGLYKYDTIDFSEKGEEDGQTFPFIYLLPQVGRLSSLLWNSAITHALLILIICIAGGSFWSHLNFAVDRAHTPFRVFLPIHWVRQTFSLSPSVVLSSTS